MMRLWHAVIRARDSRAAAREMRRQAKRRPLWRRMAETKDGSRILAEARSLSLMPEYADLTDGQLIRLAYWGVSGDAV